jgi:6,7-dimethyl-8-ribityllumazine synthase
MAQNDDIRKLDPDLDGAGLRIGIVVSRFNPEVGEGLLESCTGALRKHGVRAADIRVVSVPGALEAPLALQKLANTGRFHALIALGAVIRGETYHFEVVANESASGITTVALDSGVPVANGILTTETDEQALARVAEKGADCAAAAVEMANLMKKIEERQFQRNGELAP